MTLLVISPDYASHLLPLATLATAWRDAGDQVVVASGPATATMTAEFGFDRRDLRLGRGSNPGVIRAENQVAGEDDALRGFFEAIPHELEEAAAIDGASQLTTFHKVILPLAGPGLAAVTMFGFIRSWNEFLFALVFMQSHDLFTLPIGLASFQEEYTFRWDLLMAGAGIVTLPVLFFFLLMQRFIVQGLLGGAVKG